MTARQISLIEMYSGQRGRVLEILKDLRRLNDELEELTADPSWLFREVDDSVVYSADEDPLWGDAA